jgi:hypothetical protein
MKMKKAILAKKYKFNIRESVAIARTYPHLIGTTEKILRSSMKAVGIAGGNKIIRNNKPAIASLTKEIIETKLEVKSIRSLLERRTSKFKGLTEYDQHFIKTFAREAAISFAEYFAQSDKKPIIPKTVVYFSDDGYLYIEPKKDHCYPTVKNSLRQRIVKVLISAKGYVPPDDLISAVESTRKSVEFAINRINSLTKSHLNDIKLIDNRRTYGYRINSTIIIKQG